MFRASSVLLLVVACGASAQSITLGTQTKGLLPPSQGGTGVNVMGVTGCPKVTAGIWSFSLANCSSGGGGGGITGIIGGDGIISVNNGDGTYTISQGATFAISSFSGGQIVEEGATITNPSFTASYTSTPTSASLTNTDGISSPTALTTPYTTGTITGAFSKSTNACTTVTLTAVGASTKTATQQLCFRPRTFYGVGTTGATGATASGTTAMLTGATGTLNTFGLNTETGTVNMSPSGQTMYFLLSNAGHTFNVNGFPTTFSSQSISFVNVNGVSNSMTLYTAPTTYTGTYSVQVF